MANYLTSGKVAKAGGVNIQTVRYYERCRLLVPDGRTESDYRLYPPEAVRIIRFIRRGVAIASARIRRGPAVWAMSRGDQGDKRRSSGLDVGRATFP